MYTWKPNRKILKKKQKHQSRTKYAALDKQFDSFRYFKDFPAANNSSCVEIYINY